MPVLEDYSITCPFCKQKHTRDVNVPDDALPDSGREFLCKHPTANGMCTREVDTQDSWCWQHSDND